MNGVMYGVQGPSSNLFPVLVSIRSLRKYYNGPITVVTDVTGSFVKWLRGLDINVVYDRITYPRFYGVVNDLSPYDTTFLVPPNTMFFRNINKVLDIHSSYDLLAHITTPAREELEKIQTVNQTAYEMTREYVDDFIHMFDLDLLVFKKDSSEFFKTYEEEYLKMSYGALIRSIVKTGLQVGHFPVEFARYVKTPFESSHHHIENDELAFITVQGREMYKYFVKYQKDIFDECMVYGNVGEIPKAVENLLFQ